MYARVAAWLVLAVVVYGAYSYAKGWKNPLSVPTVLPVTAVMPSMPDGCAKRPECL